MNIEKPQYRDSNPKIDVYLDGQYVASTNYHRTIKQYMANESYKNLPEYNGQKVKCYRSKR